MLGEAWRECDSCHLHLILLLCLVHSLLVFSVCYLRHPLHTHKQNPFLHGPYFCACCFYSSYRLVAAVGWVPHVPHRTCLWACVGSAVCVTCEECGAYCFRTQYQDRGIWNKKEKKDQTKFQQKLSFRGQRCRLPWPPGASTEKQGCDFGLGDCELLWQTQPYGERVILVRGFRDNSVHHVRRVWQWPREMLLFVISWLTEKQRIQWLISAHQASAPETSQAI